MGDRSWSVIKLRNIISASSQCADCAEGRKSGICTTLGSAHRSSSASRSSLSRSDNRYRSITKVRTRCGRSKPIIGRRLYSAAITACRGGVELRSLPWIPPKGRIPAQACLVVEMSIEDASLLSTCPRFRHIGSQSRVSNAAKMIERVPTSNDRTWSDP